MNRKDIIHMAQEAGLLRAGDGWTEPHRWGLTEVERFVSLVAAAEREECAKVCEEWATKNHVYVNGAIRCGKDIRARGETK